MFFGVERTEVFDIDRFKVATFSVTSFLTSFVRALAGWPNKGYYKFLYYILVQ